MTSAATVEDAEPAARAALSGRTLLATFVLALVFMLATADRNIMAILLVPIQKELHVGDTAMALLSGTAFTVVYAVGALPLSRIADRGNRRNLIAAAVVIWSVFTSICGFATSFLTLLLARIGVALGEAGYAPATLSLVGDLYLRTRRGIAVGVLALGSAVGMGMGALVAGRLSDLHGWRIAFIVMGAPGVVVGFLLFLTLREPVRGAHEGATVAAALSEPVQATLRYLASVPSVVRLLLANLVLQTSSGSFQLWLPAFFIRVHHLTISQMSARFGLVIATAAAFSSIMAGFISDRLSHRGERWRAYYCAAVLVLCAPFAAMTVIAPTADMGFLSLFLMAMISGGVTSVSMVAGLAVVRPATRGFMSAVLTLITAVVGVGIGPVLFGAMTDSLRGRLGPEAIRYTLLMVPVLCVVSSALFFWAARSVDKDAALALGEHEIS